MELELLEIRGKSDFGFGSNKIGGKALLN